MARIRLQRFGQARKCGRWSGQPLECRQHQRQDLPFAQLLDQCTDQECSDVGMRATGNRQPASPAVDRGRKRTKTEIALQLEHMLAAWCRGRAASR